RCGWGGRARPGRSGTAGTGGCGLSAGSLFFFVVLAVRRDRLRAPPPFHLFLDPLVREPPPQRVEALPVRRRALSVRLKDLLQPRDPARELADLLQAEGRLPGLGLAEGR